MCVHMLPPPLFMWQYQYSITIGLDETTKQKLENNVPLLDGMLYCKTQSELLKKPKLNLGRVAHNKNDRAQTHDFSQQNQLN
jgi:hypothetical protein